MAGHDAVNSIVPGNGKVTLSGSAEGALLVALMAWGKGMPSGAGSLTKAVRLVVSPFMACLGVHYSTE